MKSFFKKLAFVMALAMVVSMAAPVAASAATPLNAAFQNTNTFVTELEMEVGQKIDLCFKGAPEGWRSLKRGWFVTSGDAVTVDNDGWVTAVKEGKATIEFRMEGCESAVVDIVVGEEELALVNYGQTSVNTVKLTYTTGDFTNIKVADVKLYRVFTSANGMDEVEAAWPVKAVSGNAKGEVYVTPYVQFQDGVNYRVVVNGVESDIVGVKPTVDEISYIYTLFGATADKNGVLQSDAYVTEEGTEDIETQLDYKAIYLHNGVEMDVTALFDESTLNIEYVLESPEEDDEASEYVNLYTDSIVFYAKQPAVVNAVATWANDEGKEFFIDCYPAFIDPIEYPEYALTVTDWAFHKAGNDTFSWNKESFPAKTNGYELVLKIEDNRNGVFVTNEEVRNILNTAEKTDKYQSVSVLNQLGYTFEVFSTSTDDFLLDAQDFTITTWKKLTDVAFYVDMTETDEETGEPLKPVTIYANTFDITPAAYYAAIRPNSNSITLVADAEQDMASVTTGYIYINKYNQYGDDWGNYTRSNDISVTCSNKEIEEGEGWNFGAGEKGNAIVINGPELYRESGFKTSFTFTVKCKDNDYGYTTSFKVNLIKPKWVASSAIAADQADNYVTGYVYAADVKQIALDRFSAYAWNATTETSDKIYHNKLAFTVNAPAIGWIKDKDNAAEFSKEATVYLYNTSNGQKVTYADDANYILVNAKKWDSATDGTVVDSEGTTHTLKVGDKVVALEKNGAIQTEYYGVYEVANKGNGKFTVALTSHRTDYKDSMNYANEGKYDFVVYTVTSIKENAEGNLVVTYKPESVSFTVDNTWPNPTLVKRTEYETTLTENDIKQIIVDNFDFNLGGAAWDIDTSVIMDLQAGKHYKVEGNHIYIAYVQFMVPVDGDKTLGTGDDYYVKSVTIDMSVELK